MRFYGRAPQKNDVRHFKKIYIYIYMNHESTQKHTKPVAASTSGVSSEGVGAPQAPIGGDLLGNQDAPVEGRSLSTKNNSERQLGPPFL